MAGDAPCLDAFDKLIVFGEGWPTRPVEPVENRSLVPRLEHLGEVTGVDLHASQSVGREFVRNQKNLHASRQRS
jgi:hypothetical protein